MSYLLPQLLPGQLPALVAITYCVMFVEDVLNSESSAFSFYASSHWYMLQVWPCTLTFSSCIASE